MMLKLRMATMNDMALLYKWVNDSETRASSFSVNSKKLITSLNYRKWLQNTLQREDTLLFIMTDDVKDIGQVKVVMEGETAIISYSIDVNERGKGYGTQIITLIMTTLKHNYPHIKKLTALVKRTNKASCRIFEKNNFNEKCIVYEREI